MIYRLILKIEPNSFMHLPPEVRNQIYELILPTEEQTIRLRRIKRRNEKTWSLLSFANSNRQIHNELRPLIFKKFNVKLPHFLEYPAFVDSFHTHIHEILQPRYVTTKITRYDSAHHLDWDMRALLLARDEPGFHLRLENERAAEERSSGGRDWSPTRMVREYNVNMAREYNRTSRNAHSSGYPTIHPSLGERRPDIRYYGPLYKVIFEPLCGSSLWAKALMGDVWSRFITGLRFQWNGDEKAVWTLTVANKSGKLGTVEKNKLNEYVTMLLTHQKGGHITVHVTNFKGTPGEEWFTYGHKPLVQETGQKPKDLLKR